MEYLACPLTRKINRRSQVFGSEADEPGGGLCKAEGTDDRADEIRSGQLLNANIRIRNIDFSSRDSLVVAFK